MIAFRIYLAALWVILIGYTAVVIAEHGMGLLPAFFGDMQFMGWPGQFNLDFLMMLTLSALWVSWRHQFSPGGLALGFLALCGGASFLTVYLFVASLQCGGDMKKIVLGARL